MNVDRKYIKLRHNGITILKQVLNKKELKCHCCNKELKRGEFIAIFNYPTRVICDSILCLSDIMDENVGEVLK